VLSQHAVHDLTHALVLRRVDHAVVRGDAVHVVLRKVARNVAERRVQSGMRRLERCERWCSHELRRIRAIELYARWPYDVHAVRSREVYAVELQE